MKKFKDYILEKYGSIVSLDKTGSDIKIPEIKNELNRNLDLILNRSYVTVEQALNKIRKILSMYSLDLPQIDSDDKKSDTIVVSIAHKHFGYDEFSGDTGIEADTKLKFSYNLIDGLYKCKAEVS